MVKKYINMAFIYSIIAMVFGVFYREFTKFSSFTGKTTLSVMHTHYFMLGMFFFLLIALLEKQFSFSSQKQAKSFLLLYNLGLNIMAFAFLLRGILQISAFNTPKGLNASISGIAGIGHILVGIGIILFFISLKKSVLSIKNK